MPASSKTAKPPYCATIFTLIRAGGDNGHGKTAKEMLNLTSKPSGFLGFEVARKKIVISVSRRSLLGAGKAWKAWKENIAHRQAQSRANEWYKAFCVCRVGHEYGL